jgi:hypothetical protein
MVHAIEQLYLYVEVVGCPTICRHCWAQGVGYQAMPVGDVAFVLGQAHSFCDERGLGFGAYPMHEVAAHPQATTILRLFADHVGAAEFQPLTTTGVPLATRPDWAELLTTAAQLGTTTVWVAFHGVGAEHDRQVNREGAYAETCLAIQRVHDAGLRAGCNIFLTKASAPQAGQLIEDLQRLRIDKTSWETASYYPSPRQRRGEHLRPEVADLQPIAPRIRQLSPFHCEVWSDLEAHTEAAWVRRALDDDWPTEPHPGGQFLQLVCRPNLDIHTGQAGWYRKRHGNLGRDGAQAVLAHALAQGGQVWGADTLWFDLHPLPNVSDLAAQHGNPSGRAVHFTPASVRYLWLDRAQRARRT